MWETARREAPGRVLSWRAVEAEAALAFAGLSELLAGVLDDVVPELAAPRRRALEVALLLAEPEGPPPDAHAIGLALLEVLQALSQAAPVLMALDDVQWLDPSSVAVLQVAMRRLRAEPATRSREMARRSPPSAIASSRSIAPCCPSRRAHPFGALLADVVVRLR